MTEAVSIESLVQQLFTLQHRGGIPFVSSGVADWYVVQLFSPANEDEIHLAETRLGHPLPADFRQFWRSSNGANLFLNESAMHGVGIASTELLLELQHDEEHHYGREAMSRYAVFARVNGAGDFLAFNLVTGQVVDGVHAEQPHEWRVIAQSFTEWLAALLAAEGRYFWIEALYDALRGPIPAPAPGA